jgi:RimJ/RimL family protein N-acetyltransferase
VIRTERLELLPAQPVHLRAALLGSDELAESLGAAVPATWPPEFLDRPALEFTLARLLESPADDGWWMYFVILSTGGRTLVGTAGYKGPPSADGTVEVGYGIVRDQRRQGFASESVRALLSRAFALPAVRSVIAETLPELAPSIGVLGKCGFQLVGTGSEPGVIRFALSRAAYEAGRITIAPQAPGAAP